LKETIELYKKYPEEISRHSIISGWREVQKETLDIEVLDSIVRWETEFEMFKV
jgi:hypothetical protein